MWRGATRSDSRGTCNGSSYGHAWPLTCWFSSIYCLPRAQVKALKKVSLLTKQFNSKAGKLEEFVKAKAVWLQVGG